jgi:hypothetical protein
MAYRQIYSAKKELNREKRIAAGLLSERFPKVSGIAIHMTYFHKGANPILMERTVNFFPNSYAYFYMKCKIKNCESGFDLTSEVAKVIKQHKKSGQGKMRCRGRDNNLPPDHGSISFKVTVKYNKSR